MEKRLAKSPDETLRARLVEKARAMSGMVDDMVDSVRRIAGRQKFT